MAKGIGSWLDKSKKRYGDSSGGGSAGKGGKSSRAGMGKKNGGVDGPTPYGDSKGGGKEPRGKDRPLNAPKGIKTWKR